ncbi:MAG: hypothetical protein H0W15_12035 [Gemmatimonadales bacterium]|nr:hypothetical protein [Gemmatimonadales bacterium]
MIVTFEPTPVPPLSSATTRQSPATIVLFPDTVPELAPTLLRLKVKSPLTLLEADLQTLIFPNSGVELVTSPIANETGVRAESELVGASP